MALWQDIGSLAGAGIGSGTSIGRGLGGVLGRLGDWWMEPGLTPQQQQAEQIAQQQMDAQQQLLQQMQNPNYEAQQQEERMMFQRDILPQIAAQFGSRGMLGSSAFENALVRGREDLATRLAALNQRGELSRQGMLGNYLTGQQQLGLNLMGLGQRQQGMGIEGLGGAGRYGIGMGGLGMQRGLGMMQGGLQSANVGLGRQAQSFYQPSTPGALGPIIQGVGAATGALL